MNELKICSWNIAGLKDKLQDQCILEFVMKFDLVFILESKTYFNLNVPGFEVYTNVSSSGQNRGGVVMLLKSHLSSDVLNVNADDEGQIWLTMSWWPAVKIGGVYIPPHDSPYYGPELHGALAAHTFPPGNVIVVGDFNGRVGMPNMLNEEGQMYQYSGGMDNIVNSHGKTLRNICNNNDMVLVNNLHFQGQHFLGNLTYRQGGRWVSEIDLCLSKRDSLSLLHELKIHQNVRGSDHAPISVTLRLKHSNTIAIRDLLNRAVTINQGNFTNYETVNSRPHKSLSYKEIDVNMFKRCLQEVNPPALTDVSDLEMALSSGFKSIVETAAKCKSGTVAVANEWDRSQPRLARLLQSNDSKLIWKSID